MANTETLEGLADRSAQPEIPMSGGLMIGRARSGRPQARGCHPSTKTGVGQILRPVSVSDTTLEKKRLQAYERLSRSRAALPFRSRR